jgi:hypothetical protein
VELACAPAAVAAIVAGQVLRLVRRTVPTTEDFRGNRLLVREEGRLNGTPLLLVAVAIVDNVHIRL